MATGNGKHAKGPVHPFARKDPKPTRARLVSLLDPLGRKRYSEVERFLATINGAKAALMADRIGSIEVGKEADVVLFDTRRPEWQPLINPVANLVYSATGDSVRDVFVAGEQVVKDSTLTRIDESKLYDEIPVAVMRFSKHLKVDQMVQLKWPVT